MKTQPSRLRDSKTGACMGPDKAGIVKDKASQARMVGRDIKRNALSRQRLLI